MSPRLIGLWLGEASGQGGSAGSGARMAAFANFPYEIVETHGEDALATWEALKTAGRGAPVVLGEEELDNLLVPFDPRARARQTPIAEILAAADAIDFPDDLRRLRHEEHAEAVAYFKTIGAYGFITDEADAPLGDWPEAPWRETGPSDADELSVVYDVMTRQPKPTAHIALIPTDDPTAIPAYMHWGNWNECPSSAYHVAALRLWRGRYGAELVGLASNAMNLRVSRRPATREEALELARAHYVYCNDIVDQGVRSLRALAAGLMASHWWFFWWD